MTKTRGGHQGHTPVAAFLPVMDAVIFESPKDSAILEIRAPGLIISGSHGSLQELRFPSLATPQSHQVDGQDGVRVGCGEGLAVLLPSCWEKAMDWVHSSSS